MKTRDPIPRNTRIFSAECSCERWSRQGRRDNLCWNVRENQTHSRCSSINVQAWGSHRQETCVFEHSSNLFLQFTRPKLSVSLTRATNIINTATNLVERKVQVLTDILVHGKSLYGETRGGLCTSAVLLRGSKYRFWNQIILQENH